MVLLVGYDGTHMLLLAYGKQTQEESEFKPNLGCVACHVKRRWGWGGGEGERRNGHSTLKYYIRETDLFSIIYIEVIS